MIWALLYLLGVSLWLVVGFLGAALLSRRRFSREEGVFPLAQREPGHAKWPRVHAATQLALGQRARDAMPGDDQRYLHAASTLTSGFVIAGA